MLIALVYESRQPNKNWQTNKNETCHSKHQNSEPIEYLMFDMFDSTFHSNGSCIGLSLPYTTTLSLMLPYRPCFRQQLTAGPIGEGSPVDTETMGGTVVRHQLQTAAGRLVAVTCIVLARIVVHGDVQMFHAWVEHSVHTWGRD